MNSPSSLPRCPLHPATLKHLKKGNPWITKDRYSMAFPKKAAFLIGTDKQGREWGLFLHDPTHPKVKARLWQSDEPYQQAEKNFPAELKQRLKKALKRRTDNNLFEERENLYWAFGEADALPGLKIQFLGNVILLQYYAFYWQQWQELLLDQIKSLLNEFFPHKDFAEIRIQLRNQQKKSREEKVPIDKEVRPNNVIQEFGIHYKTLLNERYDVGLYTDASAFRQELSPLFQKSKSFLNLYCYTGAFSLFALKQGVEEVHSVDMSQKVLSWLEENLKLNPDLPAENHTSHCRPVDKALKFFAKEKRQFDFILSDPPPSSHDGQKQLNALEQYEKQFADLIELLAPGGTLVALLNHHQIPLQKFRARLQNQQRTLGPKKRLTFEAGYALKKDCQPLRSLPEENYLKCLKVRKKG